VVTRRQKLIAAGSVLAIGFGLAWPLRRTEPLLPASMRPDTASVETQQLTQAIDLDRQATPSAPVASSPATSLAILPTVADRDPLENGAAPFPADPVTPPVYSTISVGTSPATPLAEVTPTERIHVVHEGDALDVLAKRYLGDEARALEIFDLNREALENPHVLPLGVELRIPSGGSNSDAVQQEPSSADVADGHR
jgi:nucleoid-associated protein YgaU